jgi:hypothetical protein
LGKIYWLLGSKSQLSVENKLLLHEPILKPVWAYDVQLWDTVSNSNIEILQRFQNKYLRIIVNAPWYVIKDTLHHDLNVLYIRDEIKRLSQRYADRLEEHPNILTTNLMRNAKTTRKLQRRFLQDLYTLPDYNSIDHILSETFSSHPTVTSVTKCHAVITACNNFWDDKKKEYTYIYIYIYIYINIHLVWRMIQLLRAQNGLISPHLKK